MKKLIGLILGICIGFSGFIFTGCGDVYANVYLSSTISEIKVAVGETASFGVEIKNYFSDMSSLISVNSDSEYINVKKVTCNDDGTANVEIEGLKVGISDLRITTFEASKECVVKVEVYQSIDSIYMNTEVYMLLKNNYKIDLTQQKYFSYNPSNAVYPDIQYVYTKEDSTRVQIKGMQCVPDAESFLVIQLIAVDDSLINITTTKFNLEASVRDNTTITPVDFEVSVIEPIQVGDLNLIKKGLLENIYLSGESVEKITSNSEILLISNQLDACYYEYELQIESANVKVSVSTEKNEASPVSINVTDYAPTSTYSYMFGVHSGYLGEDKLVLEIKYSDYDAYVVRLEYPIKTVSTPTSLYVNEKYYNGQNDAENVLLYDSNYGDEAVYKMDLAVYSLDSNFESISFSIECMEEGQLVPLTNYTDYLQVNYRNQQIKSPIKIFYNEFTHNYSNHSIYFTGKTLYDKGLIYAKFILNSTLVGVGTITCYVPIQIVEGAKSLTLASNYSSGIILDVKNGEKSFYGLEVNSETAYKGKIAISYYKNAKTFFEVTPLDNTDNIINKKIVPLKIKPIKIGEGDACITLPNGVFVNIHIIIEQSLETAKFTILQNDLISKTENDSEGNISKIAMQYVKPERVQDKVEVAFKLATNPSISTLFTVEHTINSEDENLIKFDSDNFKVTVNGEGKAILKISLLLFMVDNFKKVNKIDLLTDSEQTIDFYIEFVIYSPLKELDVLQDNKSVVTLDFYKSSDIGYFYQKQGYSKAVLDLKATKMNGDVSPDAFMEYLPSKDENSNIEFTSDKIYHKVRKDFSDVGSYTENGSFTNFGSYSISGNQIILICDDAYAQTNKTFWIAVTISQYNLKISKIITININKYVPLTTIGFYNPQETVYLSDTQPVFEFSTFTDDASDCHEFTAKFYPIGSTTSSNLVSVEVNADCSKVTISYNGNGNHGYGDVYFVPMSAYTTETEFTNYQVVTVRVSDGSEKDNPYPINTADEFIETMSRDASMSKHFLITSNLDFTGKKLEMFGEFNGSLTGQNASAQISNIKIDYIKNIGTTSYVGLFWKLGTNAEIKNLSFSGSIVLDVSTKNSVTAGFLCAENFGLIKNVSLTLKSNNIKINALAEKEIYIGGLVGVNYGKIYTLVDTKNYSFNNTLIEYQDAINLQYYAEYDVNLETPFNKTFFGGVVGKNSGLILREIAEGSILYNFSINSTIVNIKAFGFYAVGGISGINIGNDIEFDTYVGATIKEQLITGSIESDKRSFDESIEYGGQNVGGVCGLNYSYIDSCDVRSTISGKNYVGGLIGRDHTIDSFVPIIDNPSTSINEERENLDKYKYVTNSEVHAINDGVFKYMITAKSGNGNVGAFSGNESAISNEDIYEKNSNIALFYYERDIINKKYPIAYSYSESDDSYAHIKYDRDDDYYCMFRYKNVTLGVQDIISDIKAVDNPNSLGAGKLNTENENFDNRIAYMFIYQTEDVKQQSLIDADYNKNRIMPFKFYNPDSIYLTSLTPNVLYVNPDGTVNLISEGIAIIKISSLLNKTVDNIVVYIYVTNAFDGIQIKSSSDDILNNGSELIIYERIPVELEYTFIHEKLTVRDEYYQNIKVGLKDNNDGSVFVSIDAILEELQYVNVDQIGNTIVFISKGLEAINTSNIIKLFPNFEVDIPIVGKCYIDINREDDNPSQMDKLITSTENEVTIITTTKKGTEEIQTNISEITVEPIDVVNINILQKTDYSNDNLRVISIKSTDGEDSPMDYFKLIKVTGFEYNEENEVFEFTNFANNTASGVFSVQFNYEKYVNTDYAGTYLITFIADNGVEKTIIVNLVKQPVTNLVLKNYYNIDVVEGFDKSMIIRNYVSSSSTNLLQIEVYPYFSDYDYIYVKNDISNAEKGNDMIFEVVKLNSENKLETVYGVYYKTGGVYIPKSIINQINSVNSDPMAKLFIKYTITSTAQLDTQTILHVQAIKKNAVNEEDIQYQDSLNLNVVIKDVVKFSIVGKDDSNNKMIYVAKGFNYDLTLDIHGYTVDQMVMTINDRQGNETPFVSITQDDKGAWHMAIAKEVNYITGEEGYYVKITTYGENTIDGYTFTSGESYLEFTIVDYVIKTENLTGLKFIEDNLSTYPGKTVVKEAEDAVARIAIGNKFEFEIGFINNETIEYDYTNQDTATMVKQFESLLTQKGIWKINAIDYNIINTNQVVVPLTATTNISNNYFKIWGEKNDDETKTLSFSPMILNTILENSKYYASYEGGFEYKDGKAVVSTVNSNLSTDILFDVYQTGAEENALPIYTYDDLVVMESGSWYILMNDIVLPNDFVPLDNTIAGLNGNGYSIIFPTYWECTNYPTIGLFSLVNENTLLRNIDIKIQKSTTFVFNYADTIRFGLIAGENDGSITNCSVTNENYAILTISIQGQLSTIKENYVAGLVGYNLGYITNSYVQFSIVASANLAGLVGYNESVISSCYVRNSSIINQSSDVAHYTAGFAIKNGSTISGTAIISSCYVTGETSSVSIYSRSSEKIIRSDTGVAGFVYTNYTKINDCYADIKIYSNSIRCGFVYENAGLLTNTYSTSTFDWTGTTAFGYIVRNNIDNFFGRINSSFYLLGSVNEKTNIVVAEGLRSLSEPQFAYNNIFSDFIISTSINKTDGIWFNPSKSIESEFKFKGIGQEFTYGKLELVSPNIIVNSQKIINTSNVVYNEKTGKTTYSYIETKSPDGSLYNPYVIYSAQSFENIANQNTLNNINSKNYRIVKNINYVDDKITSSKLYKTIFKGILEGNSMDVSGYVIDTKETLSNGGLFGKIGNGSSGEGIIKNLTLRPKYINMPNTSNVGGIAGSLESGSLFNVDIDGFNYTNDGMVIIGYNCVGGLVGVAINNFAIIDCSSTISSRASYNSQTANEKLGIFYSSTSKKNSYAGVLVGVAHNSGKVLRASISGRVVAMGQIAGLMFGKIGSNVKVSDIHLVLTGEEFVRASSYGGIFVGENSGYIENVTITGVEVNNFFKTDPIIPTAVGGFAGIMHSGTILNCSCEVDLGWTKTSPSIIGGLVGEMLGGTLQNTNFRGNITANGDIDYSKENMIVLGGLVGRIAGTLTEETNNKIIASKVRIDNCQTKPLDSTKGKLNVVTDSIYTINVGGLVGEIINDANYYTLSGLAYITTKYKHEINKCLNNEYTININSIVYGGTLTMNVGGFVGGIYTDESRDYIGEIAIYSETTQNIVESKYESQSTEKLSIHVKDMKTSGNLLIYYGGIIGKGYAVAEYTDVRNTSNYYDFGYFLANYLGTKNYSFPNYSGIEARENWSTTDFCGINKGEPNLITVQNMFNTYSYQ